MSRRKLELYENIFNRVGPGKSKVTIVEIAAYLHCSERHARTLLNQMTTLGWLTGAVANNFMGLLSLQFYFKLRVNCINIKEAIHKGGSIPYFCFSFIMT